MFEFDDFSSAVEDMAPPKNEVLQYLSDSHLRAIGMVAAQWSQLEISVLWVLSKSCSLPFTQAIVLAGAQNVTAWIDMLRKLHNPTKKPGTKKTTTEIDKLYAEIETLQKKRNDIVHTNWQAPLLSGIVDVQINRRPTSRHQARGVSIPKRGSNIVKTTTLSAREMLDVAKGIAKAEQALFDWWVQQREKLQQGTVPENPQNPPTQAHNRLLQLLQQPPSQTKKSA